MRMDKLTIKAQEIIADAQETATKNNNHEIQPIHLLSAAVNQKGGIFQSLSQIIGASTQLISEEADKYISKLPKQIGAGPGGGQMSQKMNEVLSSAIKKLKL